MQVACDIVTLCGKFVCFTMLVGGLGGSLSGVEHNNMKKIIGSYKLMTGFFRRFSGICLYCFIACQ